MMGFDRTSIGLVAIVTFLASILAVVRGDFAYPVEFFLLAMLGILLVASLTISDDNAVSLSLFAVFFLAALANMAYLYTVAKYFSLIRIGTIGLAVIGLLISATSTLAQPVPGRLNTEVKKLIAAEKKLSNARQKLERVKEAMPAGAKSRAKRAVKSAEPGRRKK